MIHFRTRILCGLNANTVEIFIRLLCENVNKTSTNTESLYNNNKTVIVPQSIDDIEEPTTCCMSGCANCVWLEYAEKLSEYFKDGGEKAIKEINEKVSDPNIRTFLLHELRMRNKTM